MKEKRRRNRKLKFLFIACALWAVVFCWYEVGSRTNLTSLMQRPKVKTTESKETTQKRFDEFMLQVFKAMVTEDTLTLNYTLKEPEKYGVSMEKPTLGAYTLSDLRDGIMTDENWLSSLERFPYEALTEEQKLEYDTRRSLR